MNRTLFIGGASPMGSQLSFHLKKRIQTFLTVVDVAIEGKKIVKQHSTKYKTIEEFITDDSTVFFDRIIINIYELFDARTMESHGNTLLNLLNKLIDILKNNLESEVIIILNAYQYYYPKNHYQEAFNIYNELIIGFIGILTKINKSLMKLIFLPNVLISREINDGGFINLAINNLEDREKVLISNSYRDYVLFKDIECDIMDIFLLNKSIEVEVTSGICWSNSYVYKQIAQKLFKESYFENSLSTYELNYFYEWYEPNKEVVKMVIKKDIGQILNEYLKNID